MVNDIIIKRAKKYNLEVYDSTRAGKKYMILHPKTEKWIHFGSAIMEDYTQHHDKTRRENYRKRARGIIAKHNGKLVPAYTIKYSPSWLSYHLAWT